MASQLENKLCCVKHCWDVYEQNSIVHSVRVDDWTSEWAIIASNDSILTLAVFGCPFCKPYYSSFRYCLSTLLLCLLDQMIRCLGMREKFWNQIAEI